MTSTTLLTYPDGRYGFRHVARMEWIKLRTLRSTWLTLAITIAAAVAVSVAVGLSTKDGSEDLTNNALSGIAIGLLVTGVLGVLVMSSEFTSGMIRTTLAASPNRRRLLAAKAAVFGSVALVVGEVASFISFFAGGLALPSSIAAPSLGQPGVLRAVLLSGTGYCLVGLIGLGLGAIVRNTPAAVCILVGGVYVGGQLVGGLSTTVLSYVPIAIVANSLTVVQTPEDMLSPWAGLAVLTGYAAVTLGVGGLLLARRDA
jgi:ABC-2 type transport system permease protein